MDEPADGTGPAGLERLALAALGAVALTAERPMAAASIGQVHRATLPNGKRVAVKVQRPGAPRQIEADLALLYQAARIAKERVRALDFIDARQLVDEFARSIRQELDYRLEARNADVFHHHFAAHPHVHVPRVFWTYTRSRVLTLEWLDGTQVADIHPEEWMVEERRDLAYLMAETWMTMIFRHGFFHGDPHPANILVLGRADQIGLVDFGAVGKLTDDDMSKLTRMFIDAASENVEALPKRLADLGVRYPKEREEEFLAELREIYYRYYGASLAEIDPLQIIREAFQLIYAMNLRLPSRFLLLDRAIATLGSVGVDLYPDFNVFEVARPYARSLLLERFGPRRVAARSRPARRLRRAGRMPCAPRRRAGDRPRTTRVGCRRPRACARARVRRLPRASVRLRGAARPHPRRASPYGACAARAAVRGGDRRRPGDPARDGRRARRPAGGQGVRAAAEVAHGSDARLHEGAAAARGLGLPLARPDAHARLACVEAPAQARGRRRRPGRDQRVGGGLQAARTLTEATPSRAGSGYARRRRDRVEAAPVVLVRPRLRISRDRGGARGILGRVRGGAQR